MDKVKKAYKEAYYKYGNSLESLFIPKGRQKERFDSLTTFFKEESSILDYGCGFGHLFYYLNQYFDKFSYEGCDIVDEFIAENRKNINEDIFYTINSYADVTSSYDFIVAAGVFNLMYTDSKLEQFELIKSTLKHLFTKTNRVLSVNFMTDQVDFVADNAYHQNVVEIYLFSVNELSRRVLIDQTYMPYEFTIHIFKNDQIVRPDNVFIPL
jgi:cyclopropane fatty-acyl-phospholipid synthase-like methyltransferase